MKMHVILRKAQLRNGESSCLDDIMRSWVRSYYLKLDLSLDYSVT